MVDVSLAWLQLLAAALDVLENEGLIRVIRANPNQPNPDLVMFTAVRGIPQAWAPHGPASHRDDGVHPWRSGRTAGRRDSPVDDPCRHRRRPVSAGVRTHTRRLPLPFGARGSRTEVACAQGCGPSLSDRRG